MKTALTPLSREDLQKLIDELLREAASYPEKGLVADYIPELAKVDPEKLGIAVATVEGDLVKGGDADELFSIQSISKVFFP